MKYSHQPGTVEHVDPAKLPELNFDDEESATGVYETLDTVCETAMEKLERVSRKADDLRTHAKIRSSKPKIPEPLGS